MFFKDVFRLINSTYKRFFAIAAIVFIGVAFMMGLLSNTNIMRDSVNDFNNEINLQDIQVYSSLGFDDNDIEKISNLDYVDEVFASKTRDVYCNDKDNNSIVVRVRELDSNVNSYVLEEGRLPESNDECIYIDNDVEHETIQVGKRIDLYLEDEDLSESIKNTSFKIVGKAKSSEYMSKMLSTSLLDNRDLDAVILIPNSNFISDYYSTVYFTIKDARNYNSFENEYFDYIKDKVNDFESFADTQKYALKDHIVEDAKKEIEDGKKELEDAKIDGQKELNEAYQKLIDARKQIDDGKKEIEDNESKLIDGQEKIDKGLQELKDKEKLVNESIKTIEDSSGMSLDDFITYTQNNLNTYNDLLTNKQELEANKQTLVDTRQTCLDAINQSPLKTKIAVRAAMLLIFDKESDTYKNLEQLLQAFDFLESYNDNMKTVNDYLDQVNSGIKQIEDGYSQSGGIEKTLSDCIALKDGKKQIKEGYSQIEQSQKEIDDGWVKLEEGKQELAKAEKEYRDGYEKYLDGVEEYNKKIADAEDEIQDAENKIKDLDDAKWIVLDRDSQYSHYMYKNSCTQMNSIGIVMPIIFFLVAALVCSTTMKRLIDEQRGQIGIYSALGYTKSEIAARYLSYVLIATLSSSIIAVFAGMAIFPTVIYNTWRLLYYLPNMKMFIPLDKLVICILSFVVLMCFVSYITINSTLKECSAQLMRPKAPKNSKEIILEKIKFIWNRLSFTSKITARNIFRYKSRFLMTIIGIAGCTGLLVLGFGIKDSISDVVNVQYQDFYKYDYIVNLNNDRHLIEINNEIKKDRNNESLVNYLTYSSKVFDKNNNESVIIVEAMNKVGFDTMYNLYDYKTKELLSLPEDGVIITEKYARNENINVGDRIRISSNNGTEADVTVKAIAEMYFQHYMYISDKLYSNIFNEDMEYTNIAVTNEGDSGELLKLPEKFNDVASTKDFSSFTERFNLMIEALDLIILVIIITSGALAFVVLINLTNVNISERTREIATLKVLGFNDKEVNVYIFKEIILLSIIGAIIGLPLGVIEVRFVMQVIDMEMIMFPHVVKTPSFIYSFIITMIFTFIVFMLTKKTLKKVNMVESLKSVE